ncbi:MAG TPA: class I SAM-dependent methyltransferase [Microlunatus sp.]
MSALPFEQAEFDAVLSVDALEYFGTDVRFLPSLLPALKSGGRLGVSTPGLAVDPYLRDPPAAVSGVVWLGVGRLAFAELVGSTLGALRCVDAGQAAAMIGWTILSRAVVTKCTRMVTTKEA